MFNKSAKSWPPKVGVTIGKFKPMHLGHELMIDMAASELDELTVIVSDTPDQYTDTITEDYPLNFRYKMIVEKMRKYPNVPVLKHTDVFGPPAEVDENGTGIGDEFWNYWTYVFKMLAPDATYFVSSDYYGQEAAKRMSTDLHPVEWFPVDPGRELMPISATKIRDEPIKYWNYISQEFRQKFGKRVLVIGPESTGKSTLVKDLGQAWASPVVPEYGRILSESLDNSMGMEHFRTIAKRHHEMESFAMRNSNTGLIISDTDVYTTYLFGKVYLGKEMLDLMRKHSLNHYDLVIILPPNIPWVDDGTRVLSAYKDREWFFNQLKRGYKDHDNVMILEEIDRQKRVDIVSIEIAKLMDKEKDYLNVYNGLTKQDTSLNMVQ